VHENATSLPNIFRCDGELVAANAKVLFWNCETWKLSSESYFGRNFGLYAKTWELCSLCNKTLN